MLCDGFQFPVQAFFQDFRKGVPVQPVGFFPAAVNKLLFRPVDFRRVFTPGDRPYPLIYHIRDFTGVFHHHFVCPVSQIGKFLKHFGSGFEIHPGFPYGIGVFLTVFQYLAVDFLIFFHKVNVAGGNAGLFLLVGDFKNPPVYPFKFLFSVNPAFLDKKAVVAFRHYFKIVVKIGGLHLVGIGAVFQHCLKYLPRFAGGAYNKPFPITAQHRLGYPGIAVKVVEIGKGNQFI